MRMKTVYLALVLALVFSLAAAIVPVQPAAAQGSTIFADDFEYTDSLEWPAPNHCTSSKVRVAGV